MVLSYLRRSLLIALVSTGTVLLAGTAATAIFDEMVVLLTSPLNVVEVARWRSGVPPSESVVTEGTISQTDLTIPSLWWAEEQFGGNLLDYWVAYTGADDTQPRRVDLLINQQVWVRYNYLERYAFLSQFGTSASDFGYSTRIFNWRGDLLGAYICAFSPADVSVAEATPDRCQVFLDSTGAGALSGTAQPGALPPINGGTGQ